MENKVDLSDLVIISRMEYDRIIEFKNKFYFENKKLRNECKIYEDYFYNTILEKHNYEIENIDENNFALDDYYVRHIIIDIFEYGNVDIDYIIQKIKDYKSRKESKSYETKK